MGPKKTEGTHGLGQYGTMVILWFFCEFSSTLVVLSVMHQVPHGWCILTATFLDFSKRRAASFKFKHYMLTF